MCTRLDFFTFDLFFFFLEKVTSSHFSNKTRAKTLHPSTASTYTILRGEDGGRIRLRKRGAVLEGVVLKERRGEKTGKGAAAV